MPRPAGGHGRATAAGCRPVRTITPVDGVPGPVPSDADGNLRVVAFTVDGDRTTGTCTGLGTCTRLGTGLGLGTVRDLAEPASVLLPDASR